MFVASYRNTERSAKVEPTFAEKWTRATDPLTRREDARREMERQGIAIFKSRGLPAWALDIVKACAGSRNVSLPTMAGDYRFRNAVKARNEAMYLIYLQRTNNPNLSCPRIGKWFDRDHTSVLHGIASHQEANNLPKLVGYDLARVRQRNAAISRATNHTERA